LYSTAIRLGELQSNYNIQVNPEEYANENLKFGLVEVVYEWAKVSYTKTHQFNLSVVLDGL
jgi:antiviral helicase SKI2